MRKRMISILEKLVLCCLLITQNLSQAVLANESTNFHVEVEGEAGTVQIRNEEIQYEVTSQNPLDIYIPEGSVVEIFVESQSEIETVKLNEEEMVEYPTQSYSTSYTVMESNSLYVKFKEEIEVEQEYQFLDYVVINAFESPIDDTYIRNACLWRLNNGAIAFCGYSAGACPTEGFAGPRYVLSEEMCENFSMARKILYYGYNGPKNILGELPLSGQLCVTNDILQKAVSGIGTSELVGNDALKALTIDTWWSVVEGMKNPPSSFNTYMIDYSINGMDYCTTTNRHEYYQKLFYGEGTAPSAAYLKLTKSSSLTEVVKGNSLYSLKGCTYGIYTNNKCDTLVSSIVVDKNGQADVVELDPGIYYVKEIKVGKGYSLNTDIYEIELIEGETFELNVQDVPGYASVEMIVQKEDSKTKTNKAQGNAVLSGAEFELKFYAGNYEEGVDPATLNVEATKVWTIQTNEKGQAYLNDKSKVSGDSFYKDVNGNTILPYGTLTIVEKKAPQGYTINKKMVIQKIEPNTDGENIKLNPVHVTDSILCGEFEINKVITDGQQSEIAQAEYGAKFIVVLKKYYDLCERDIKKALEYAKKNGTELEYEEMTTNEEGIAKSNDLAFGKYVIEQVGLGENGAGTEMLDKPFYFDIALENGKKVVYGTTYEGKMISSTEKDCVRFYINDIPFQSYVSIVKKDKNSNKTITLNSSIFKIKMLDEQGNPVTNYEKPKLKTDKEGYISIKVGLLSYDQFATNADNTISILDTLLDHTYVPGSSESKGKVTIPVPLPEGKYVIEEVKAPSGFTVGEPISFTIEKSNVVKDGDIKTLEVVYKDEYPTGKIILKKEFNGEIKGEGSVTFELRTTKDIVDPVNGEILYKKGDLVNGVQIFKNEDGSTENKKIENGIYTVDANSEIVIKNLPLGTKGNTFVMKECSTYSDFQLSQDELIYTINIKDEEKSEYVAKNTVVNEKITIKTSAHKKDSTEKNLSPTSELSIVDTVTYKGLTVGEEYHLQATLIDKGTGKAIKDKDGKNVVVSQTFTPKKSTGSEDVIITIDGNIVRGKTLVVFEKLMNSKNELIASHEDKNDTDQTVEVLDIQIHTLATSENGAKEIQESGIATIYDDVYLEGLNPGTRYVLYGTLMDKKNGQVFRDMYGNEVQTRKEFVYKEGKESELMVFQLDTTGLSGASSVVFEKLYEKIEGKEVFVASHEDLNDENQEINIIDIKTTAKSDIGSHNQLIKKENQIKDIVSYEGLMVGKEYTVKGTLMDMETEQPLLDQNGNPIVGETTFSPLQSKGEVEVTFTFTNLDVKEVNAVVFEDLYRDNILIATHSDINDVNQTMLLRNMKIKVNKVDSKTKRNILNKDFEFTLYSDKECTKRIAKASIDTTFGFACYENIPEGISYIKESKAPKGYSLSNQVIKVERKNDELYVDDQKVDLYECFLAEISYENTPETPNTSVVTNMSYFMITGLLSGALLIMLRKMKN